MIVLYAAFHGTLFSALLFCRRSLALIEVRTKRPQKWTLLRDFDVRSAHVDSIRNRPILLECAERSSCVCFSFIRFARSRSTGTMQKKVNKFVFRAKCVSVPNRYPEEIRIFCLRSNSLERLPGEAFVRPHAMGQSFRCACTVHTVCLLAIQPIWPMNINEQLYPRRTERPRKFIIMIIRYKIYDTDN